MGSKRGVPNKVAHEYMASFVLILAVLALFNQHKLQHIQVFCVVFLIFLTLIHKHEINPIPGP